MKTRILTMCLAACLFAVGGCSSDDPEDKTLTEMAKEPLDKASQVETEVLEAKDKIDAALDETDGGDKD